MQQTFIVVGTEVLGYEAVITQISVPKAISVVHIPQVCRLILYTNQATIM